MHVRSSVREVVGQHVPHRVVCFIDRCLLGTQCVLLSFAQRHTLFILQLWNEGFANRCFCRKMHRWLTLIWILVECVWVYHNHTPHATARNRLDIIQPRAALLDVQAFQRIVLRENRLAQSTPLRLDGDRCVPRVELQIKRQLIRTRAESGHLIQVQCRFENCVSFPLVFRPNEEGMQHRCRQECVFELVSPIARLTL